MLNVPNLLSLTSVTLRYSASTGGSEKHPVEKIRSTVKNTYSSFHSWKIICFVRNVLCFCGLTFSFTGPPPAEYQHSCWWYHEDDEQSQTNRQLHNCGCLSRRKRFVLHFLVQNKTKVTNVTTVLWILDDHQSRCFSTECLHLEHAQVECLYQQSHLWPLMIPASLYLLVTSEDLFLQNLLMKPQGFTRLCWEQEWEHCLHQQGSACCAKNKPQVPQHTN